MSRPLKVGVQLPEVERVVRWPEQLAMARMMTALSRLRSMSLMNERSILILSNGKLRR